MCSTASLETYSLRKLEFDGVGVTPVISWMIWNDKQNSHDGRYEARCTGNAAVAGCRWNCQNHVEKASWAVHAVHYADATSSESSIARSQCLRNCRAIWVGEVGTSITGLSLRFLSSLLSSRLQRILLSSSAYSRLVLSVFSSCIQHIHQFFASEYLSDDLDSFCSHLLSWYKSLWFVRQIFSPPSSVVPPLEIQKELMQFSFAHPFHWRKSAFLTSCDRGVVKIITRRWKNMLAIVWDACRAWCGCVGMWWL